MIALPLSDLEWPSDAIQTGLFHQANQPALHMFTYKNFIKEGHIKTHKNFKKEGHVKTQKT